MELTLYLPYEKLDFGWHPSVPHIFEVSDHHPLQNPEASKNQEVVSSDVVVGRACMSLHRLPHSTTPATPNCLLKGMCPLGVAHHTGTWTMMKGSAHQLNRQGNIVQRGPDRNHQSSKKKVFFPLQAPCLAPNLKYHFIFSMAFQN
jgi:hypothetical protein